MTIENASLVDDTDNLRRYESRGERISGAPSDKPPLIVIEPTRSVFAIDFRELYAHRELLYLLVWRDLKVRYKQAILGMGWVVLQPLFMTLVFTIVLGRLVRVPSGNVPYSLFAYAGLMLWIFFSGAISIAGNCLVGNAGLITKVYFPRLIIPVASIVARLVDLIIAFVILVVLMFYYRIEITTQVLMTVPMLLLLALLSLGFGLWMSALNVKYRDVGIALPVLIQLWMFMTPVVYGMNLVPQKWKLVYSMNPLVGIFEGFRAALFGTRFEWRPIIISTGITLFLLLYGTYTFQRRERNFADIV